MKKKLLSIMLSLTMVITMMPAMALTAFADGTEEKDPGWGALQEAMRGVDPKEYSDFFNLEKTVDDDATWKITLKKDIVAKNDDTVLEVTPNRKIMIDMNGFAIDRGIYTKNSSNEQIWDLYGINKEGESVKGCGYRTNGHVISVQENSQLTIEDNSPNKTGKITGGCYYYNPYEHERYMQGHCSGGIYNQGQCYLRDIAITENYMENCYYGGGGFTQYSESSNPEAVLTNVVISYNYGSTGSGGASSGGLGCYAGKVVLNNCSFIYNTGRSDGAAIHNESFPVEKKSTVEMTNGIIQGNVSIAGSGGGIYNGESGSTSIKNVKIFSNITNSGYGGGVNNNGGELTLEDCIISNNEAYKNGGGINLSKGCLTIKNSQIIDNSSNLDVGGINLNGNSINIEGKVVVKNNHGKKVNSFQNTSFNVTLGPRDLIDNLQPPFNVLGDLTGSEIHFSYHVFDMVGLSELYTGKITTGYKTWNSADPQEYFYCDAQSDYYVDLEGNEAFIKEAPDNHHVINIPRFDNGTIKSNVKYQQEGQAVELTVTPKSGYKLKGGIPKVTSIDGTESVEITENNGKFTFTMPGYPVNVSAVFALPVTINKSVNGKLEVSVEDGEFIKTGDVVEEGKAVLIKATPDKGFELAKLAVTKENGEVVELTNNKFTMPDEPVTISAEFQEKASHKLYRHLMTVAGITAGTIAIINNIDLLVDQAKSADAERLALLLATAVDDAKDAIREAVGDSTDATVLEYADKGYEAIDAATTVEEVKDATLQYVQLIGETRTVVEAEMYQYKLKAAKTGSNKVTFKNPNLDRIMNYQVVRSTKKDFSKNLKKYTVKTNDAEKLTMTNAKKLKKGTRYYYKVRAKVELSDGNQIYTDWSNVRYMKCKKTR